MALVLEKRGEYLSDPTACAAIARVDRKLSQPKSLSIQQLAYQLAVEMVPNMNLLTRKQVATMQEERRGRSKIIQSLEERLQKVSRREREDIVEQLHRLQTQQGATRIVIKNFRRINGMR